MKKFIWAVFAMAVAVSPSAMAYDFVRVYELKIKK